MEELILQSNLDIPHPFPGGENNSFLDSQIVNPLEVNAHISLHASSLPTIARVKDLSHIVPTTLSWDNLFGWQQAITSTLQQFAQSPDFQSQIHFIFGDNFNAGKLNEITSEWLVGNFNLLPHIEVLDSSVFPTGTLGAFAGATNKIYINEQLLSSENTELIQETVIEEVGHWVDKEINRVDAFGDEGQLFAAVVTGKHLNAAQIAEIKTEDDTTTIFADGQFLTVEQATIAILNEL